MNSLLKVNALGVVVASCLGSDEEFAGNSIAGKPVFHALWPWRACGLGILMIYMIVDTERISMI